MVKRFTKFRSATIGILLSISSLHGAVVVPGFNETSYVSSGLSEITGIAWAPDATKRLFVMGKSGVVRIVENDILLSTPFVTISPVRTTSECGLIGMAFDPNFLLNRYVYFFVTVSASEQQIIRYEANGNLGINKTVLISGLPTVGANHDGGGIGVGFDGKLYWSIGDLGNGTGVDSDLFTLAAKVGRANLNGTVFRGNPFWDGPGPNNDYIWARGFRNPFTLTFNPFTGDLWVNVAGTSYEQIFLVGQADHAGYNDYENNQPAVGYISPKIKYRTGTTDSRTVAGNGAVRNNNVVTVTTTSTHRFRRGEKITIAGVADSTFNGTFYIASIVSATSFTVSQSGLNATSGGGTATTDLLGSAVTGGCFYDSTAFPAEYRTNFFFCDYSSGRLNRAVIDANNEVLSVDYFATSISLAVDVATGPDGALYCAGFNGALRRIASTNAGQRLVVSPAGINMAEGGESLFKVQLFQAPVSNVTVTLSHASGDSDISITNTTLVFTPANFNVPQNVRLFAAADDDSVRDQATFTVTSSGTATETVFVNAYDLVSAPPLLLIAVTNGNARIRLEGGENRTHILQGTTNFVSWNPLATNFTQTNGLVFLNPQSNNFRFYRTVVSE